jgi:hypothetical protein
MGCQLGNQADRPLWARLLRSSELGDPLTIYISNPLPRALSHYENELAQTLTRVGLPHSSTGSLAVEDRPGAWGMAVKLKNAVQNSRHKAPEESRTIQCWPSLGLLEPALWHKKNSPNLVVFHDPVPIRKQIGFDPISRKLASKYGSNRAPAILVHSDDARVEAQKLFPKLPVRKALHPILSDVRKPLATGSSVIVAGQFKPERNLSLLAEVGPLLRAKQLRPRIFGRGWPEDIPGWEVDSRFLAESELDAAIDDAAVVLIPYRNYFQSGIAIRALERGTLSVSPENSFARDVFGAVPETIYRPKAQAAEVLDHLVAVADSTSSPREIFEDYRRRTDESWTDLLSECSRTTD